MATPTEHPRQSRRRWGECRRLIFNLWWISTPSKQPNFGTRSRIQQLGDLIADQVQKDANGDLTAMFMALESVLRSIVKEMGSPKGLGQFARFLRDHPDKFPMFSTVPDQVPSTRHVCN